MPEGSAVSHPLPQPASLPGWLPDLWSHVLFRGRAATGVEPCRLQAVVLLVLVPGLLLYPSLSYPLFEPDESRYAQIPREMLQRGEAVVPYLQGEPYLDKPPLLYWLVEGSYALLGVKVGAARLVPALALHLCVLLTYLLGRRSLGERPAFWGALILSLAPGFVSVGRLLIMDGLLTLWVTLALLATFEAVRGERLRWGWWLTGALACGLGVLTKGPVALVLLAVPVGLHRWLTGASWRIGRTALASFGLVVLLVALPWYVAMCVRVPAFAWEFLWEHNVRRFLAPYAHQHGIWFYAPVLLAGLLPGTLLLLPLGHFLLSGKEEAAEKRTQALGFMVLGGLWCLLFFSLSACKLPTYVMPAFPPLALALGYYLAQSRWSTSHWPRTAAATAFVLLCLGHHLVLPWYAGYRSPVGRPDVVERLCGDRGTPVVCYPRSCDSVAFYLGRDDLRNYRSRSIEDLRALVRARPRTVILCTHRHSLQGLHELLPPDVRIVEEVRLGLADLPGVPPRLMKQLAKLMGETALGLCDVAVVERGPGNVVVPPAAPRILDRWLDDDGDS